MNLHNIATQRYIKVFPLIIPHNIYTYVAAKLYVAVKCFSTQLCMHMFYSYTIASYRHTHNYEFCVKYSSNNIKISMCMI